MFRFFCLFVCFFNGSPQILSLPLTHLDHHCKVCFSKAGKKYFIWEHSSTPVCPCSAYCWTLFMWAHSQNPAVASVASCLLIVPSWYLWVPCKKLRRATFIPDLTLRPWGWGLALDAQGCSWTGLQLHTAFPCQVEPKHRLAKSPERCLMPKAVPGCPALVWGNEHQQPPSIRDLWVHGSNHTLTSVQSEHNISQFKYLNVYQ